jgi:hypothetical protein
MRTPNPNPWDESLFLAELFREAIGMQTFDRLVHLLHYVYQTEPLGGTIVEFGCHEGHTAKLIAAITEREVHVYDSFQGLPDTHVGFMGVPQHKLMANFAAKQLRTPIVHAGWFKDLKPEDVPSNISFAHLDGDCESSTLQALNIVWPNLVTGAIVLVDDYGDPWWPGVKRAVDDFCEINDITPLVELRGLYQKPATKAVLQK